MLDESPIPTTERRINASWAAAAILIVISTGVLGWLISGSGTSISWKDPRHYYRSAISFAHGDGWGFPVYSISADSVSWVHLSHFPPGPSLFYALLIVLGIPPALAPIVVNLIMWFLLLVSLGLLVQRLSQSSTGVAWTVALGAITWPIINRFLGTVSEAMFLPVLILLTYWLTDSAPRQRDRRWWCVLLVLLTLLLQTRYVSIFLYAGVAIWWTIIRWRHSSWQQLIVEWGLLALPGLSLLAWTLRNLLLVGNLFGPAHLTESSFGLRESVVGYAKHLTWFALPSIRPGPLVRNLGWELMVVYGVILALLGILVWRYRARWQWIGSPARSPLLALLIAYFAVFTVLKPFFLSYPMDERFMSVNLVLIQPFLIAVLLHAGPDLHGWRPGLFVGANGLLLAVTLWTAWGQPGSPYVPLPDPAGYSQASYESLLRGVPSWLIHNPPRTLDRRRYLPEVDTFLASAGDETVVISNAPELFTEYPIATGDDPLEQWLVEGKCAVAHPVFLVVVDWDRWAVGGRDTGWDSVGRFPQDLNSAITAKCPSLQAVTLPHATIYPLLCELNTISAEAANP